MSVGQCKCGKHRLKRKVSIDNAKGDIAAKYQDLRIVRDKSSKWKEMVQCYKLYQNISTSECAHQDMMKGLTISQFGSASMVALALGGGFPSIVPFPASICQTSAESLHMHIDWRVGCTVCLAMDVWLGFGVAAGVNS
jgi:hypothetical protein